MALPSEMKAAEVVAVAARQVASALQVLRPAEGAVEASGAQVQPQEAAEAESAPSVQRLGAAAGVESGVGVQPPEVAGAALDAAAEPQQAVAEALPDAEVLRPGAVERPEPSARRPAAERPSALPSWRPGGPHLWLAP